MNTDPRILLWAVSAALGLTFNLILLFYSARRWRLRRDRRPGIRTLALAHAGRDAFRVLIQGIGFSIGMFAVFQWHLSWIIWGLIAMQWVTVILAAADYAVNVRARNQEDAWEAAREAAGVSEWIEP